jgi:3-isopropylmalate/(R)-2-methylmalate dehydratase small subunit
MTGFAAFSSRVLTLLVNDVDTDQIIPARFLKVTDKLGLGENLFADWRYNADGSPKEDFVLNKKGARGARILLAGDNFGCGSSREHAPWALTAFGFQAVISTSFADIFASNALKNRLLPIKLGASEHRELVEVIAKAPETELTVDLAGQAVRLPDGKTFAFPVDSFSKVCLLKGVDELGYLLKFTDRIAEYEQSVR